jgi:hypothetical protein
VIYRAVDGIVHVMRAFDDADIVHVEDRVDPVGDIEIISRYIYLSIYLFIHIYIPGTSIYLSIYLYMYICICLYICIYTCIYVCACVCVYL